MIPPSNARVANAMIFQQTSDTRDASREWEVIDILAAEVRRLRGVIDTVASMADDCAEELKAALRT